MPASGGDGDGGKGKGAAAVLDNPIEELRGKLATAELSEALSGFERDYAAGLPGPPGGGVLCVESIGIEVAHSLRQEAAELQARQDMRTAARHTRDMRRLDETRSKALLQATHSVQADIAGERQRHRDARIRKSVTLHNVDAYFQQVQARLKGFVDVRKSQIRQRYGELTTTTTTAFSVDAVDWDALPQQVEIRIAAIRGVRDKIPPGDYALLVSKFDKLGGSAYRWSRRSLRGPNPPPCPLHPDTPAPSCEVCRGWLGCTPPVAHGGSPFDVTLSPDTSVYTCFPPRRRIKPYASFMFELVRLPGGAASGPGVPQELPQTVGWAAFPVIDQNFTVIKGRFRTPMLRGAPNSRVEHYSTIQGIITEDVEAWLGNLYFEVLPYPRECDGRSEFDIQAQESSERLSVNPGCRPAEGGSASPAHSRRPSGLAPSPRHKGRGRGGGAEGQATPPGQTRSASPQQQQQQPAKRKSVMFVDDGDAGSPGGASLRRGSTRPRGGSGGGGGEAVAAVAAVSGPASPFKPMTSWRRRLSSVTALGKPSQLFGARGGAAASGTTENPLLSLQEPDSLASSLRSGGGGATAGVGLHSSLRGALRRGTLGSSVGSLEDGGAGGAASPSRSSNVQGSDAAGSPQHSLGGVRRRRRRRSSQAGGGGSDNGSGTDSNACSSQGSDDGSDASDGSADPAEEGALLFGLIDSDGSGVLSREELSCYLERYPEVKGRLGVSSIAEFLALLDSNNDGMIDRGEFAAVWAAMASGAASLLAEPEGLAWSVTATALQGSPAWEGGGGGGGGGAPVVGAALRRLQQQQGGEAGEGGGGGGGEGGLFAKLRGLAGKNRQARRVATERAERWGLHTSNVNESVFGNARSLPWSLQLEYCWRGILDELHVKRPHEPRFWFMMCVIALCLYGHVYLHGLAKYLAVAVLGIPTSTVEPRWYGLHVDYDMNHTTAFNELFILLVSAGAGAALIVLLVLGGAAVKFATASLPDQISKFVYCLSLAYFVFPFVQAAVDSQLEPDPNANGVRQSDLLRLSAFYTRAKYEPFFGAITFAVIYLNLSAVLCTVNFFYTMRIHLNGILQDCYWRINVCTDRTWFMPNDLEVSKAELEHICAKAERWRGQHGERRKTCVSLVATTDEADPHYLQKQLHIEIYTINPFHVNEFGKAETQRRIYREFYVLPDGGIVEARKERLPTFIKTKASTKMNAADVQRVRRLSRANSKAP